MNRVCRAFETGALPPGLIFLRPLDTDLRFVAEVFVRMQEQRHAADYNLQAQFSRTDTLALIDEVEAAFDAWNRIRQSDAATYFLFAFFFYRSDRWRE